MENEQWLALYHAMETLKNKGNEANKGELAEQLKKLHLASTDTHEVLETWHAYLAAVRSMLVNDGAVSLQETVRVALDLAKNTRDAWDVFMVDGVAADQAIPEAEIAFDKLMRM